MIIDALASYIRAQTGLDVYVGEVPLESQPCWTINDIDDYRDKHWTNGQTVSGIKHHYLELTYWADLGAGGSKQAAIYANDLLDLLDNFTGAMVDDSLSPNVNHRVLFIQAENGGGDFIPTPEIWGQTIQLTIQYD